MSDFEQWWSGIYAIPSDEEAFARFVWQAAIASMQGDAVARMVHDFQKLHEFFVKHSLGSKTKPSCFKCGSSDHARAINHMELPDIYICESCALSASKIAEQDARIKELEQQLGVARKDAERWNAILHSGAYCPSDFGNPIGFSGRLGQYTKEQLNASVDDYISKHCNAAIRQIWGAE